MPKRRRISLALVAAAAAAAVTVPIIANAGPGSSGGLLPDLVSDAPDGAEFNAYNGFDNAKLLLRFNGYVHNAGDGPVDLQGNPQLPAGTPGAVDQYLSTAPPNVGPPGGQTVNPLRLTNVGNSPSSWVRVTDHKDPEVVFDNSDTHNHFHVQRAAEYSLWNAAKTAQVVPGAKVGFCLYDVEADPSPNGPGTAVYNDNPPISIQFCQQGNRSATTLREGISEGYRDVYDATLDYQWIDVSNVPPGDYYLAGRMDPDDHIKEKDETNNSYAFSAATVRVPGYRALAVATTTGFRTPKTFSLASQSFGPSLPVGTPPAGYAALGTLRYRVESVPAGGTLRNGGTVVSAGTTLPAGVTQLSYTPNTNFSGVDTFAFSAVNFVSGAPSRYPLQPAQASASVQVGPSGIAINVAGVPGQIETGAQAQLTATASTGGVTWTVDGVTGGNATVGTISPTGLYTAPVAVPAAGKVTIQALSTEDVGAKSAAIVLPIVRPTPRDPTPIIQGTLQKPGVLAVGRNVTLSVTTQTAGKVSIDLFRGRARLGGCSSQALAGQTVTCKVRMKKAYDPGTLTVKTALTANGTTTRFSSVAGVGSFTRVSARHRGGRVLLSVVPKRPGLVRLVVTRKGRIVAQCSGRVLAGRSLNCTRSVRSGALVLSVSLKDNQGRFVLRESSF